MPGANRMASGIQPGMRQDILMLRITIHETTETLTINLEGRVTGPFAAELQQAWDVAAQGLKARAVFVDLRNVLYVDEEGKRVLRAIEAQTGAELIATTPWARQLAAEICGTGITSK